MRMLFLSDTGSNRFHAVKAIVSKVEPSLILMAGDLVDDDHSNEGSPEKWAILCELIGFFNESEIQTFFIEGNWDKNKFYDRLVDMTKNFLYVEEISEKVVEFNGIKILGVPFSFTNRLETAKRISERFPEPVNIVLAHAELARRIWLFELDTQFIVTGHFDTQLFQVRNKVFISLSGGSPLNCVLLEHAKDRQIVTYIEYASEQENGVRVSHAEFVDGQIVWKTKPLESSIARGRYGNYAIWIESLMQMRDQIRAGTKSPREAKLELQENGIPKKHIREYIGGA